MAKDLGGALLSISLYLSLYTGVSSDINGGKTDGDGRL